MEEGMSLTIAIPTCGRTINGVLTRCLNSLAIQTYTNFRILIIDDNLNDPSIEKHMSALEDQLAGNLRRHDPFDIIKSYHINRDGFPVHNIALSNSDTKYIFRLDDDFYLESQNFIATLLNIMDEHSEYGAVSGIQGGNYYYPDCLNNPNIPDYLKGHQQIKFYKTEHGYDGICDLGIQHNNHHEARLYAVEHIHSSYIYRREVLEKIGGFTEELFHGEETVPLIQMQLLGYKVGIYTGVKFTHGGCHEGGVRGQTRWKANKDPEYRTRYQKKLLELLENYRVDDGDTLGDILCRDKR